MPPILNDWPRVRELAHATWSAPETKVSDTGTNHLGFRLVRTAG